MHTIPTNHGTMKLNDSPKPKFTTDELRLWFLVGLPVHRDFAGEVTAQITGKVGTKPGLSWDQVGTKSALSQHQVEILEKCREPMAVLDLIAITGRTDCTKFRQQVPSPLLDAGLIEMTIPDKPRSSNQQYRLSAKSFPWKRGVTQPQRSKSLSLSSRRSTTLNASSRRYASLSQPVWVRRG